MKLLNAKKEWKLVEKGEQQERDKKMIKMIKQHEKGSAHLLQNRRHIS